MDLQKLEYFIAAAKYENITKAAGSLFISQPALSTAVTKLEEEVGHPLFYRIGRGISLSEYGRALLPHAESILNEWKSAKNELRVLAKEAPETIEVGMTGEDLSRKFILDFTSAHPDFQLSQHSLSYEDLQVPALYSHLDFILSSLPVTDPGWENVPLFREKIKLCVSGKHPFATQESVSLKDLSDQKLIMLPLSSVSSVQFMELLDRAGVKPVSLREVLRSQLIDMISRNMGVGFLTADTPLSAEEKNTITLIDLREDYCFRTIYLIFRKNKKQSEEYRIFQNYIMTFRNKTV